MAKMLKKFWGWGTDPSPNGNRTPLPHTPPPSAPHLRPLGRDRCGYGPEECYVVRLKNRLRREKNKSIQTDVV